MAVPGVSYGEVRNTIKEIDMQIVYRRLEARKKNITNDGKMSKKQMASAYRGYHGLEAQYHAMVRMSDEAMMNTKVKNDHLHTKHNEEMRTLEVQRQTVSRQSRREIDSISDEFRAQLAYQYVYKNHSFKRFDTAKPQKKSRPTSDKPEMYDPDRKLQVAASLQRSNSIIRPLGSLRQMENYKNELRLPPLADGGSKKQEREKSKVNMMGDKQSVASKLPKENTPPTTNVQTKSFPKIEGAMGVEIKYKYKLRDDDKESLYSAPAGLLNDDAVVYAAEQPALARFDMGQNLIRMRQKGQENYSRQRALPVPPSTDETKKQGCRRVLPATPSRPSSVYPRQETNPIDHKKAMRKEVTEIMETWDNANTTKRLEIVEKLKQLERDQNRDNPPPTFDTSRPTSAILRDYQQYKKTQEERKYTSDKEQPITVQQMTVQPRPESPSVTRRNQYSARIQTPSRLKRTVSERSDKFSSVSRNASFKDISEDLEEMALNALLTAAERIEKEKEKRNSAKQRLQETDVQIEESEPVKDEKAKSLQHGDTRTNGANSNERRRRMLPQPPQKTEDNTNCQKEQVTVPIRKYNPSEIYLQDAKSHPQAFPQKKKLGKMFNTEILAKSNDQQTIEEVHKANDVSSNTPNTPIPLKKLRPGTPLTFTDDDGTSSPSSSLYMFSAKPIPQHIKDRMRFEYDNYSRRTPNAKKKLELRAKNRRKIQQQNKLLQAERDRSFVKDSDRASTQVSFNESVMVFQTI